MSELDEETVNWPRIIAITAACVFGVACTIIAIPCILQAFGIFL